MTKWRLYDSLDGGITWTPLKDYSRCGRAVARMDQLIEKIKQRYPIEVLFAGEFRAVRVDDYPEFYLHLFRVEEVEE